MISLKTEKEIALMKVACNISAKALEIGGKSVKAGMSTKKLDKIIHDYIIKEGAKPSFLGYGGFKGSACISVNDTVIHGIPSEKIIIQKGDIVSIDVGAYINGFHGDNAATFVCGTVPEETQRLLDVTKESLVRGISAAIAGNRVGDIGEAVQTYVEENGYSVVREFVGHGVGKDLHESPEVPNFGKKGKGPRLIPGMVIAIEPMVNQGKAEVKILSDGWTVKTCDGSLATHFEHTVLITKDGPVILTTV